MDPITVGSIGFLVLFILLVIGVPVGISMALTGFAGLWYLISFNASMVKMAYVPFETVASWDLATLPLFIFMAEILFISGLGTDMYNLAAKWLGRLPGGIAMATVVACGGFAAVSSSAVATAVTMGTVALPEMKKLNYRPTLANGSVAAGGTIGVLIPPSGPLIIYGILTGVSIGKLFMAGLLPGILQVIFYVITIYTLCVRNPSLGPKGPSYSIKEKLMAFGNCGEFIVLIFLILGGLEIGWFTPTEAGAVGAAGAIALSLIRKRLDWSKYKKAIVDTLRTTGMIYGILIGAFIFKYFMAITTIPFVLADFISGLDLFPWVVMLCIIVLYILLGIFMEEGAMMVLTIPIFFPLAISLGFNGIWFGILVVRMMQIGMISPPLGITMFVVQGISKESLTTIYKGVIPFLLSDAVHVALLLCFPAIALFLPSLMR